MDNFINHPGYPINILEFTVGALPSTDNLLRWYPTGSNYICDPPVTNTDRDFIVLAKYTTFNTAKEYRKLLIDDGWEYGGSNENDPSGQFYSFKKGVDNLILTWSVDFYLKYVLATQVAKQLNLLEKPDRIMVFQAIINNEFNRG